MNPKNEKTNPAILCPTIERCIGLADTFDQTVFCWAEQLVEGEPEDAWTERPSKFVNMLMLTQWVDERKIICPAPTCQEMKNYISSTLNAQKDGRLVFPSEFDKECRIYGYQWIIDPNNLADRIVLLRKKIKEFGG